MNVSRTWTGGVGFGLRLAGGSLLGFQKLLYAQTATLPARPIQLLRARADLLAIVCAATCFAFLFLLVVYLRARRVYRSRTLARVAEQEALLREQETFRREHEAIAAREKRLRELVERAVDGIFLSDEHGRGIEANPQGCAMLGYTAEELLAKSAYDLVPDEDTLFLEQMIEEVGHGGTIVQEMRVKRKDGTSLDVELSATRLPGGQLHAIVRDISARKNAEAALRQSEALLRSFYDTAPVMMGVVEQVGSDLVFISVNPAAAAFLGDSVENIRGKRASQYLPNSRPLAEWLGRQCTCTEARRPQRFRFEHHDGLTEVWLLNTIVPLEASPEGRARFSFLSIDVTEQERLERKMVHAQKLESLGVLAGGIAHDFNNLLLGVLGNADLALLELPQSAQCRRYIKDIITTAQRAAELCNQMLAYSGRGQFALERIDLRRLIEDLMPLLEISIAENATLTFDAAAVMPQVEGDAAQLRQVVMNLVLNASEALEGKSGAVSISAGVLEKDSRVWSETLSEEPPEGPFVHLTVADNGCGMDRATRARVFDPFFSTKFAGRGLGMAAVSGIIRAHRGMIHLHSEPRGGTTVKVLLPACVQDAPSAVGGSGELGTAG